MLLRNASMAIELGRCHICTRGARMPYKGRTEDDTCCLASSKTSKPPPIRVRQVTLLAHSAGGWLARAFLGDERHFDAGETHVAGTSHNRWV